MEVLNIISPCLGVLASQRSLAMSDDSLRVWHDSDDFCSASNPVSCYFPALPVQSCQVE